MTKNHHIPPPHSLPLLHHRRRQGRSGSFFPKSRDTYDYNNVWIRKVVGNDKTIFIPENYQTTVQIDNGTVTHHYLWTPQTQDKLLADTTTDGVLWSLTDHLGTVRDILGETSTHLIYDAFGNLTSGTNPILFGYTGKAFDTDTQLQNNINRWYDASVGRWLSTDPIDFRGNDTNLYRYVRNNSFNRLDVMGLKDTYKKCDPEIRKKFIGYTIKAIGVIDLYDSNVSSSMPQGSTNPSPVSGGISAKTIQCGLCKEYEQIQTCHIYRKEYIYGIIPCDVEIAIQYETLKEHSYEIIKTQNIQVGILHRGNSIHSGTISLLVIPVPGANAGPGVNVKPLQGFLVNMDLEVASQACRDKAKQLWAASKTLPGPLLK